MSKIFQRSIDNFEFLESEWLKEMITKKGILKFVSRHASFSEEIFLRKFFK